MAKDIKQPKKPTVGITPESNGGDGAQPKAELSNKQRRRLVVTTGTQSKAVSRKPTSIVGYNASIYPKDHKVIPVEFGQTIEALEKSLRMPIWLLVQGEDGSRYDGIYSELVDEFLASRIILPEKKPVALLIDSPGGSAKCAYQIATILRRHCGHFTAVVPRYAKSAATLLSLGADTILLGQDAELGPLDAQFLDPEREGYFSALDEVQTLERLHAFALEAIDRSMYLLTTRSRKKIETLLPVVLRFVSDMTRPLFEKIDVVHFTQMSRALKVAEEYAIRLLQPKFSSEEAEKKARHLVEHYEDHDFLIDFEEALKMKLPVRQPSLDESRLMDILRKHLGKITAIGRLQQIKER